MPKYERKRSKSSSSSSLGRDKFSDESGRPEVVHYVDRDIINAYYNATRFGSVYQLKPEFDKRKCIKDGVDGKGHFADE